MLNFTNIAHNHMQALFEDNSPFEEVIKVILKKSLNGELPSLLYTNLTSYPSNITIEHLEALKKAKDEGASAIYFKYIESNKPYVSAYIYDGITKSIDNSSINEYHKKLYSGHTIPTFIIINKTHIEIYNARKPIISIDNETINKPVEKISISKLNSLDEILKILSFLELEEYKEGVFKKNFFSNKNNAYSELLKGIDRVKEDIIKQKLNKKISHKLLITCILIKYLEENGKDSSGKDYAGEFFKENTGFSTLFEILKKKELLKLIDALNIHFQGKLFDTKDIEQISDKIYKVLVRFFDTSLDSQDNYVLWPLFSFKHIPVELISLLYESFLTDEAKDSGSVYTPPFLVEFLINEALPLNIQKNDWKAIKILDPSCGSGVFLVYALKRLVQNWKLSNDRDLNVKEIYKIIKQCIYGIDIDQTAVDITVFSIYITISSLLSPKKIWTELTFESLDKNFICGDFFDQANNPKNQERFDLIVGNPPFDVLNKDEFSHLLNKFNISSNKEYYYPSYEIALLFLEQAMKLLSKNGSLCLIEPSGPLLYVEKSKNFRNVFFKQYHVKQIIDLTLLRRILYSQSEDTTVSTLAIFVRKTKPDYKKDILHLAVRRTKNIVASLFLDFDYYDLHTIDYKTAIHDSSIWKSNLYCGSRLYQLSNYIKENSTPLIRSGITIPKKSRYSLKLFLSSKEFYLNSKKRLKDGKEFYFLTESDKTIFIKYLIDNQKIASVFISGNSGRQAIRSPYTIGTKDLNNIPIIDENLIIGKNQNIILDDVYEYYSEDVSLGENSKINTIIDFKLQHHKNLIKEFCNVVLENLNRVRDINSEYNYYSINYTHYHIIIKLTNSVVSDQFQFVEKSPIELNNHYSSIFKVIFLYDKNDIYLIKPRKFKYWLKSTALRDFDSIVENARNI